MATSNSEFLDLYQGMFWSNRKDFLAWRIIFKSTSLILRYKVYIYAFKLEIYEYWNEWELSNLVYWERIWSNLSCKFILGYLHLNVKKGTYSVCDHSHSWEKLSVFPRSIYCGPINIIFLPEDINWYGCIPNYVIALDCISYNVFQSYMRFPIIQYHRKAQQWK